MKMFNEASFNVFTIDHLDGRMEAIRADIQPIFQDLGDYFIEQLTHDFDTDLYLHIAQHRRRTVYPPESTWAAISTKSRGYKMQAHLQMAIWPEYVALWLSMIDQPKNKKAMADLLLQHPEYLEELPEDFVFSKDHTQASYQSIKEVTSAVERFARVKKSELAIGRVITKEDDLLKRPEQARDDMLATFRQLVPLMKKLNED